MMLSMLHGHNREVLFGFLFDLDGAAGFAILLREFLLRLQHYRDRRPRFVFVGWVPNGMNNNCRVSLFVLGDELVFRFHSHLISIP